MRKAKNLLALSTVTASLLLSACINEKDYYQPEVQKAASDYFNFATTGTVSIDLNYGALGAGALIEIYTENPVVYNEDGSNYTLKGEAIYKSFADNNGCIKATAEFPSALTEVFLYTYNWGIPMLMTTTVTNGKILYDYTHTETRSRAAASRVVANPQICQTITNDKDRKLYSIVNWGDYGTIIDANGIMSTDGTITAKQLTAIQQTLWGSRTNKPEGLNNSDHIVDTNHMNVSIAKAYKNDNGETVNVTDAELSFTFLTESAWHQNTVGYYYYKTGECPTDPKVLDHFIIIPNASIGGSVPFTALDLQHSYATSLQAPMKTNQKFQLLFREENGQMTTKFPAGYTVGFFLIDDGFERSKATNHKNVTINGGRAIYYSNKEWNDKARFIAFRGENGNVVYGIEDGTSDYSLDDVLFTIDANPNEAIQDPELPEINPTNPIITTTQTAYRTYAYEDIWPTGGDYDLNDVIINHKRVVTFDNADNKNNLRKIEDTFTPVQPAGSASYINAFAVQYANRGSNMTLPQGVVNETETNSVILFADTKAAKDVSYTVTREFDNALKSVADAETTALLNPFIIARYTAGKDKRTEVHLPKMKATAKADASQIGSNDDAYYVSKEGKYPFAIEIPESTVEGDALFIPVTERVNIAEEYTKFTNWVEKEGKEDADWYKTYTKKQ